MKNIIIKREVRTLNNITMEVVKLEDSKWLVTIINAKEMGKSTYIKTILVNDKEELKKLKEQETWKKGKRLDIEEIETSYDDKNEIKEPVDEREVEVSRENNTVNITQKNGDKERWSMIKYDERDGIIIKYLKEDAMDIIHIPRGIYPLKNIVVECSEPMSLIRRKFSKIRELENIDKKSFLTNVYSSQMIKSFLNEYREPPKAVTTLIDIKKDDTIAVIKGIKNDEYRILLYRLNGMYHIELKENENSITEVIFDTDRQGLIKVIRSFMAYIGLGLDDIDIGQLEKMGVIPGKEINEKKQSKIYIEKYGDILENVTTVI